MDRHLPLLAATAVFLLFLGWKLRPRVGPSGSTKAKLLQEARARISAAKTDDERALALCDAGDACTRGLGGSDSAVGYYLRAMRAAPRSADLVSRASAGLARRPRALESLLWRRLGAEPWTGDMAGSARVALDDLAKLYAGPLHNAPRARALEHARALLGAKPSA
jgi:hypothetical protein